MELHKSIFSYTNPPKSNLNKYPCFSYSSEKIDNNSETIAQLKAEIDRVQYQFLECKSEYDQRNRDIEIMANKYADAQKRIQMLEARERRQVIELDNLKLQSIELHQQNCALSEKNAELVKQLQLSESCRSRTTKELSRVRRGIIDS